MTPHTTKDTPTAESAPAQIAALPTLSSDDVLREKLRLADRETADLRAECAKLLEHRDHLAAQVVEMEGNPFTFALANMDAGAVLEACGEELQKLAAIVRRRESKGTFTLKIALKPFKGEALDFIPEIKITEPKPDPAHAIFYADDDGNLSRNDPRQKEFTFSRGDRSANGDDDPYADERRRPNHH